MKKKIYYGIITFKKLNKMVTLITIILMIGCSSSDDNSGLSNPPNNSPFLNSLEISSSNGNELDINGINTTTISVLGIDQFGESIDISEPIEFSSSNNNVSVDSNGNVTAQAAGSSVISASVDDITQTINFTVIDTTPQTGTFIYVSDAVNFNTGLWKIYRYDEDGSNGEVFIDEDLAWPQDIVFLEDVNQVLISNLSSGKINKYNATTGALINSFATGIGGPTRMKIGPDNLLYVLQWSGNGLVSRYQLDGTFVDHFTSTGITQSIGLDWDSNGNLYISSYDAKTITKFDTNGNNIGVHISTNLQGPTNIWIDENDNFFVCDWTGGKVVKFDADGNFIEDFITGLSQVEGVDFFPNGNILLGNGNTSEVKLYSEDGTFIANLISAGSAGLVRPNAVRIRVVN